MFTRCEGFTTIVADKDFASWYSWRWFLGKHLSSVIQSLSRFSMHRRKRWAMVVLWSRNIIIRVAPVKV